MVGGVGVEKGLRKDESVKGLDRKLIIAPRYKMMHLTDIFISTHTIYSKYLTKQFTKNHSKQ